MITESSRINLRTRSSYQLTLPICVLLITLPVDIAFSQKDSALQPPEESSNSANVRRKRYVEHEVQVQKLVTRLKTMTRELGQDDPTTVKLRSDLRDAVRQSFEARQELQRAELAEFVRRMKNLQQTIDARDRIADKIVERRLEELQDPALNWEATESVDESKSSEKAVTDIDPGISEKIEDGAWGEPVSGLRMAVVNLSDNAPSDKSLEIFCILENVSDQRIVLHDGGLSLQTECDIRKTSKAQVKTIPVGMNTGALSGDRDKVLDPGQKIVISRMQICITDDPDATEVPDSADLLIVDKESSRFHNAIYLLRANLRAQFKRGDGPSIALASGQIAIAFHDPKDPASSASDEPHAKDEITESSASTAPPILLSGISIAEDNRTSPTSDAEKAIARLVLVFFQDQARRAVPGLMIDRGTETLVLTTGPATIVPDGVPHAMDRAFLELPGEADVEAEFVSTQTKDLYFHRAKPGLTTFQLEKPVALAIGDSLSAILLTGQTELLVTPNAARITALDQATTFALETHKFRHEFSGLVEIDQRLPEGTPLFKDGNLAGIVLLGTRFLGDDARQSLVVPAERIFEVLGKTSEKQ